MHIDDEITPETMKFSLLLTLADLKFSEFAAYPLERQVAIAIAGNLTLEELARAVLQLGAIQRVRYVEIMRLLPAAGEGKPS